MDSILETGYTRGKVLKRAGVGAAGLFAAPMFVSTALASTDAVSPKVCIQHALNGDTNAGIGPCETGDSAARPCPCHMGGFVGPVCDPQLSGRCFCFMNVRGCPSCRDTSQLGNACTSKSDCPRGWDCVYTCLDACPGGVGCCDTCTGNSAPSAGASGAGLVCLPPCKPNGSGQLTKAARALVKAGG